MAPEFGITIKGINLPDKRTARKMASALKTISGARAVQVTQTQEFEDLPPFVVDDAQETLAEKFQFANFGQVFKYYRLSLSRTQKEVGVLAEVDRSTVKNIENHYGKHLPRTTTIVKLIKSLDLEKDDPSIALLLDKVRDGRSADDIQIIDLLVTAK